MHQARAERGANESSCGKQCRSTKIDLTGPCVSECSRGGQECARGKGRCVRTMLFERSCNDEHRDHDDAAPDPEQTARDTSY